VAKVAEGDEEDDELNSPDDPKSGSMTADEFGAATLKHELSVAAVDEEEDVGMVDIEEPL
jgi:hypothetical protein